MLNDYPLTPRLPAADIDRARAWYEATLGLTPARVDDVGGGLWYETGGGWFHIFPTPSAGTAQNTAAGWTVNGLEHLMDMLRGRGAVFEEYDFGEMGRTVNGLLDIDGYRAAWLKDSEGNILELSEVPE